MNLSTDSELVSKDTEMIRKTIQQKIQEHSKSGRSLEPVDIAVEVNVLRLSNSSVRHKLMSLQL